MLTRSLDAGWHNRLDWFHPSPCHWTSRKGTRWDGLRRRHQKEPKGTEGGIERARMIKQRRNISDEMKEKCEQAEIF